MLQRVYSQSDTMQSQNNEDLEIWYSARCFHRRARNAIEQVFHSDARVYTYFVQTSHASFITAESNVRR